MESVVGRTAFITGGASGIGLSIGEALLAVGCRVVLADRDADAAEREARRLGSGTIGQLLDVTDRAGWASARKSAERVCGPIDILVNNAGLPPDWNELVDMPFEHFDRLVAVMLTGVFNGIRTFGQSIRERRGHIVNTSSMSGLVAAPRLGAYTAAKFGVVGLSEVLRAEMEPYGCGVSVLLPGGVNTNLNATSPVPDEVQGLLPHPIEPNVVGECVVSAIRENRFYVITHPEYRRVVADRSSKLLAAFDPAFDDDQGAA